MPKFRIVGIFSVDAPTDDLAEEYVNTLVNNDVEANKIITNFNISVSREFVEGEPGAPKPPKNPVQ